MTLVHGFVDDLRYPIVRSRFSQRQAHHGRQRVVHGHVVRQLVLEMGRRLAIGVVRRRHRRRRLHKVIAVLPLEVALGIGIEHGQQVQGQNCWGRGDDVLERILLGQ